MPTSRSATATATASVPTATSGRRRRRGLAIQDSHYLWLLVALEVGAIAVLRKWSSGHHGG